MERPEAELVQTKPRVALARPAGAEHLGRQAHLVELAAPVESVGPEEVARPMDLVTVAAVPTTR